MLQKPMTVSCHVSDGTENSKIGLINFFPSSIVTQMLPNISRKFMRENTLTLLFLASSGFISQKRSKNFHSNKTLLLILNADFDMFTVFSSFCFSPTAPQQNLNGESLFMNLLSRNKKQKETRLLVSGRSPESSDCLLTFMEQ